MFAYVITPKSTPRDSFYILGQEGNLLHFSDMLRNLFYVVQNAVHFIILSFSVHIIHFFVNNAQKFKYQPSCLKVKAGGRTVHSEIHSLNNSIWNKEEFAEQWKESISVPIYKNCVKTDYSNYLGISLLSATYKILSNIFLSRLTAYAEEFI